MPLVDITTKEGWHNDADQSLANRLGQALPAAFVAEEKKLHLDEGTPEDAVQVDFHEYHPRAVNAVDIWLLVRFTEDNLTKAEQREVRDAVKGIVEQLLDDYAMQSGQPVIAIDCFWGPGAGCIIFRDGRQTLYW